MITRVARTAQSKHDVRDGDMMSEARPGSAQRLRDMLEGFAGIRGFAVQRVDLTSAAFSVIEANPR